MNPLRIIRVLCIIGVIISGYLLYLHFVPEKLDTSFCNISEYFSCSTVNKSSYALLFGVPVALIGVIGFLLMGWLSFGRWTYHKPALVFVSLGALGFMLYLLAAEVFVIRAVCIFCIAVLIIVLAIVGISGAYFGKETVQFLREIRVE